jgi:hypothetical protein
MTPRRAADAFDQAATTDAADGFPARYSMVRKASNTLRICGGL